MKSLSKIVSIVVSALFFVSVVGCGGEKINPNELKIVYLLGGYGSGWIEELKTVFEAEHPGIGVRLEGSKSAKSQAEKNIGSSKNTDDLYIVTGYNWQMAAAQGKLLSLDGLYGEPVGGGDETLLKDKILDVYANAVKAEQGGEQHYYRVPWTAATGGIFYNAKMFREKGWQVPQTYGELVALCETIKSAQIPIDPNDQFSEKVKPFVWTGGEEYYWDYLVFDWWGQIAGIDEINKFLEYKSATVYDGNSTDGAAYKSLKRAYELWYNLIAANYGDTNSNSMGDSVAKAYMIAQQNFVSGKAAMIPNGHWLYNEMLEVMPAGFEMDIMPAPWVDGAQVDNGAVTLAAKTDSDGEKVRASYLVGPNESVFIPASTTKSELAKDFIKLMVSDRGCRIFLQKANSLPGSKFTTDKSALSSYQSGLLTRMENSTVFSEYSSSKMYVFGDARVWPNNYYYNSACTKKTDNTPAKVFDSIASFAASNWAVWASKAG